MANPGNDLRYNKPRYRKPKNFTQPWKYYPKATEERHRAHQERITNSTERFLLKYKAITNTKIYNLSNKVLTPLEELLLGLGIKYLPLPKTSPASLQQPIMDSIDDMHRKLRLTFHFVVPSRLTYKSTPKNTTKERWQPDKIITRYITSCKEMSSQLLHNSRSFFNEDDNTLLTTLKRLKSDKTIIIKPAEKNLGLVILSTDAYSAMCLTHLNDTTTYHPIDTYHPNQIFARLKTILNTHH